MPSLNPAPPPAPAAATPAAPAPTLVGTPYSSNGYSGTIYNFSQWVQNRLKLGPGDSLKLFHHTRTLWGTPGQRQNISDHKSGGVYGKGFYTSTKPETGYGQYEFQLSIPVSALAGRQILEVKSGPGDSLQMPPGVDVMVDDIGWNGETDHDWFIFKPGSQWWVNSVSDQSQFDKPGDPVGWN